MSNYLTNLQKNAFSSLVHEGHFFDPLTAEVEEKFMPWLLGRVEGRLEQEASAREVTDGACGASLRCPCLQRGAPLLHHRLACH